MGKRIRDSTTREGSHRTSPKAPGDGSESELDFAGLIAARTREVADKLKRLGVDSALPHDQQARLTDIVARYSGAFELYRAHPKVQGWLRTDTKYGAGTRRAIKQKVERAKKAIDDALARIAKASRRNTFIARAFGTFVTPHLKEARESLGRIRWSSQRLIEPTSSRVTALGRELVADPRAKARAALSDFFLHDANLPKGDADRRTALVEREFGWAQVAIDDEYKAGDPGARGASAIRHSRTRRQRRNAARKSRP